MTYTKVFIIGSGRCGTTWAFKMVSDHPRVISTHDESKLYRTIGPFITGKYEFDKDWERIVRIYQSHPENTRMKRVVHEHTLLQYIHLLRLKNLPQKEKAQHLIRMIIDNFFTLNKGDASHVFVEKTPAHYRYVHEILEMYPEARIVCLMRDGRDVCVSLQKEREKGAMWCPKKRIDQIRLWKSFANHYLRLTQDKFVNERMLTVKYEHLITNTEQELMRIFDFIGVDASPQLASRIAQEHHISTYIKNKQPNTYKGVVGEWQNEFSEQDVQLFHKMCADISKKLGYEL